MFLNLRKCIVLKEDAIDLSPLTVGPYQLIGLIPESLRQRLEITCVGCHRGPNKSSLSSLGVGEGGEEATC